MNTPLQDLLEFLRFPSVSTDSTRAPDMRACGEWLVAKLSALGLEAGIRETPGHPVVLAKSPRLEGRPTVMIYGHYDVQPEDPLSEWTHPPFDPQVIDGTIYARGATDNKGQILAHIEGVGALLREGALDVNVIFLIEGEEEVGSTHLGAFLEANREELACDVIAVSDTGMVGPGIPTLTYGLRGLVGAEVRISGPAMDLHSGTYGGAIMNPAVAVSHLVASFHAPDGRIAVEGFYDGVVPVQPWEREMGIDPTVHERDLLELTGVPALVGEEGFTAAERTGARPTLEINGIGSGYQGEGSKTIIPATAFVKITCRTVPDQDPDHLMECLRAHVERHAPAGVRVEFLPGQKGMPYLFDPFSPWGEAALTALRTAFGREPVLIREGGSIAIIQTFSDVLGVPTVLMGLALPDCRAHSPNENFPVENLEAGMRMSRAFLLEVGRSASFPGAAAGSSSPANA